MNDSFPGKLTPDEMREIGLEDPTVSACHGLDSDEVKQLAADLAAALENARPVLWTFSAAADRAVRNLRRRQRILARIPHRRRSILR